MNLKFRSYALAGALAMAGGVYQLSRATKGPVRTEAWMEQTALKGFGKYRTESNMAGDVTYRMDKATYAELQPFGIVARIMNDGNRSYDVTLIASSTKASFHDPRVCFTAQGWELGEQGHETIHTKTRGDIQATVARLKGTDGEKWGAFLYRGPEGFTPTTNGLKLQMFKEQLFHGRDAEGVFYRFIPTDSKTTKEEMVAFVRDYLDASDAPTHGYF